ncbi:hypothetical protein SY83_10475 [Paenibacillus swuensis]|uniref:Uncharacterized protein n=1 Tax=Paenibacillus swuensis TaxID=1178515 RepID=A0A172THT6_9BACL|nr:hypothetical protein [Paenibacillus swuensis]ANE46625.1 hypothetical protein SY83_10475 [Paenibacillus swuensis]
MSHHESLTPEEIALLLAPADETAEEKEAFSDDSVNSKAENTDKLNPEYASAEQVKVPGLAFIENEPAFLPRSKRRRGMKDSLLSRLLRPKS